MLSLLDACLSETAARGGSPVVSEQHDAARIDWRAGLSDPAEMLKIGRGASEAAGIQAGLRRASLDTSTGKIAVVVVGEPAWHKLGVNVSRALTSAEAIRLASLDWTVSKRALAFKRTDGIYTESREAFAVVRDDTQAALGVVGSRYASIQNAEGFDFLDSVIGEFGAKFHTAGAIYGGGQVWMQCELPGHNFEVVTGDSVQTFALFTNPHDGSGKAWCFPTTNRVVCANTFRTASTDKKSGLGIRHTGNVRAKVAEARRALGVAVSEIDQFKDAASQMVREEIDAPAFFSDLLDMVCDVTAAEARVGADALAAVLNVTQAEREFEAKRLSRVIAARSASLEDILRRYESDRCGVGGIRGTKWAAFNAVTEHADYGSGSRRKVGTEQDRLSRRFESVLNGEADEIKQTAYQMLTRAN